MKTKIYGEYLSLSIDDIKILHSNAYTLLFSENNQQNIASEIERMENEIALIEGFVVLKNRFGLVMNIISQHRNETQIAEEKIVKTFQVTQAQATAFMELSWEEIEQTNFDKLLEGLHFFCNCYKSFYGVNS